MLKNLPPNVYLQSYLQRAGVRFDVNIVDTVVKKGFGLSFYVFWILLAFLIYCYTNNNILVFHDHFYTLSILVAVYQLLYIYRVFRFNRIRKKLRMDSAPIIVEAYAIVLFDVKSVTSGKLIKPRRSAILYKECGSLKPRFFTGAVKRGIKHHYYKDQIARVFIDRKNAAIYSLDDDKFYQTASGRLDKRQRYSIGELSTKLDKVSLTPVKDNVNYKN